MSSDIHEASMKGAEGEAKSSGGGRLQLCRLQEGDRCLLLWGGGEVSALRQEVGDL